MHSSPQPSVAFLIFRMNCYRVMASAIDAALARGWHVECWHDIHSATADPTRTKDVPNIAEAPAFRHGQVTFREYSGWSEAVQLVAQKHVDVVVSVITLIGLQPGDLPDLPERSYFVLLEPSPSDWIYSMRTPEQLRQVDLFAITTPQWIDHDLQILQQTVPFPLTAELVRDVRQKMVAVGWPQADQCSQIDPVAVRRKWGIPAAQPVVVYLNLPRYPGHTTEVFRRRNVLRKAYLLWKTRRPLSEAWASLHAPDIGHVLRALRTFCNRNGAYLIGKYRYRDKVLPSEQRIVDKIVYDESYYPHVIIEVMRIADVSFSFYSWGLRESIAAGVPHAVLHIPGMLDEPFLRTYAQPGGFFGSPDVVRVLDVPTILRTLPHLKLNDFQVAPAAYDAYYRKYIGLPGVSNSEVFLDAIQRLIGQQVYR